MLDRSILVKSRSGMRSHRDSRAILAFVQGPHPGAQARRLRVGPQQVARGHVVEVVVDAGADNGDGMSGQHIQEEGRREGPAVVLADGQALAAGEEAVELRLVLDQALRAG